MLLKLLSDPKEAATMLAAIGNRTNNPKSQEARHTVDMIIEQVRLAGDQALKHYTEKFDGAKLEELRVPPKKYTALGNSQLNHYKRLYSSQKQE